MREVIVYLDEDTDGLHLMPDVTSFYFGSASGYAPQLKSPDESKPDQETMPPSNLETIKDLHRSGFSADDIVKLKAADLI